MHIKAEIVGTQSQHLVAIESIPYNSTCVSNIKIKLNKNDTKSLAKAYNAYMMIFD